jgi:hypothetical protein
VPAGGTLQFVSGGGTLLENGSEVIARVSRSNAVTGAPSVSVLCQARAGTATAGADYVFEPQVLTWAVDDLEDKICRGQIVHDTATESDEQFTVNLSDPTGGATLGPEFTPGLRQMPITIRDVPAAGRIEFTLPSRSWLETDGEVSAVVQRVGALAGAGAASVVCRATAGSALAGTDYTFEQQVLTWADGDQSDRTCRARLVRDGVSEPEERFTLTLSNVTGGTLGSTTSHAIGIRDVALGGHLHFGSVAASVREGFEFTLIVRRSDATALAGAASVLCQARAGTATAADFVLEPQVLTWSAGDLAVKSCRGRMLLDGSIENGEQFAVTLSNVTGDAALLSNTEATITVVEPAIDGGVLAFASPSTSSVFNSAQLSTANENAGVLQLPVRRLQTTGVVGPASAVCAIASGTASSQDVTVTPQTLTWAAGDVSDKLCTVSIIDDTLVDPSEYVIVELRQASGARLSAMHSEPSRHQITIVDNDTPTNHGVIRMEPFITSVAEFGTLTGLASSAAVSVRRTGTSGTFGPASVTCNVFSGTAAAGQDFTVTPQVLTWAAGDNSQRACSVTVVQDSLAEGAETFTFGLSQATGAALALPDQRFEITIEDDETMPVNEGTVGFGNGRSLSINEGTNVHTLVYRDGISGLFGPVAVLCELVAGTAGEQDYAATAQTLSWAAGDITAKTCSFQIRQDTLVEETENLLLRLTKVSGEAQLENAAKVVTIRDDDGVANSTAAPDIAETTITIQDDDSAPP